MSCPTIAVMPITTREPSARIAACWRAAVQREKQDLAQRLPIIRAFNASIGRGAQRATRESAEEEADAAVMPMPRSTDQGSSRAGSGVSTR